LRATNKTVTWSNSTMATAKPARKSTTKAVAKAEATAPAATTAVAERTPLSQTIDLAKQFPAEGGFTSGSIFRFNKLFGGALAFRQALFTAIAQASPAAVNGLSRKQTNAMFAVIRQERARYYGDARRQADSAATGAKKGDPLPKLTFDSTVIAASYGAAIRAAMLNLRTVLGLLDPTA
jgi:hypothetical protein